MRVNAIVRPAGDQVGHASSVASSRGAAADAGTAVASSTASTTSFFTLEAYGRAVRRPSARGYLAPREQRIHLHHVPGRQVLRPGATGAVEHLPLVPARS